MRDAFLAERDAHFVRDADFVCDARLRRVKGTDIISCVISRISYRVSDISLKVTTNYNTLDWKEVIRDVYYATQKNN